jgi:hypothetical protein
LAVVNCQRCCSSGKFQYYLIASLKAWAWPHLISACIIDSSSTPQIPHPPVATWFSSFYFPELPGRCL